jgi:hypothetical protein
VSLSLSGLLHGMGRLVYMIKEEAGWRYISAIMAGHGIPEYIYIYYPSHAPLQSHSVLYIAAPITSLSEKRKIFYNR